MTPTRFLPSTGRRWLTKSRCTSKRKAVAESIVRKSSSRSKSKLIMAHPRGVCSLLGHSTGALFYSVADSATAEATRAANRLPRCPFNSNYALYRGLNRHLNQGIEVDHRHPVRSIPLRFFSPVEATYYEKLPLRGHF